MYSAIDVHDLVDHRKYEFKTWQNISCHAHCHYIFEAVIVLSGTFKIEKEHKTYILGQNQMMFIMPFEIHKFHTVDTSEILVIQISPQVIPYFETSLKHKAPKNPVCRLSTQEINQLSNHLGKVPGNEFVELNCIFFNLLSSISQDNHFREYTFPNDTFRKMLIYVSTHFEENICLKDVARQIGVSYPYLSRLYRQNIDICFNDFINGFRIQKSVDMLLEKNHTISEICYLCGFGSIRNFNRVFLREMHCTPKQFREIRIPEISDIG